MPKLLEHVCKLFADDSKLVGAIKNITDSESLQSDLEKLVNWSNEWNMKFNAEKCKVMYIGNKNRPKYEYTMEINSMKERHTLIETNIERDLGIQISNDLK